MEFEIVYMPKCKTEGCENDQSFMFLYCNDCTIKINNCDTGHKEK